jgi:hypothetical protein
MVSLSATTRCAGKRKPAADDDFDGDDMDIDQLWNNKGPTKK